VTGIRATPLGSAGGAAPVFTDGPHAVPAEISKAQATRRAATRS